MKIALALLLSIASASVSASPDDFPNTGRSWRKNPETAHLPSLERVVVGMDKREIYHILGKPHFNEGLRARHWVYWYAQNGRDCLYKISFVHGKVANQKWNSSLCAGDSNK